jgi:fatty-acyl-CoA synthase
MHEVNGMEQMLEITMGKLLELRAEEYPDIDAVVYPNHGIRWSWREFNDLCDKAARGFMAMGVKKGDHVAIWATNYPEWLICQFATAKIGAVLVTVNTNYKIFEAEYLLKQSDSMTLVLIEGFKDSKYAEILYQLCPELEGSRPGELASKRFPFLKNVILIGQERKPGMFLFDDVYDKAVNVTAEQLNERQAGLDRHDVINMQYTSGTTGFPKGVMLTHYNVINDGKMIGDCMKFTEKDRLCIPVPLFHCFGCVLGVMASVTHGTTMVMVHHFQPVAVMEAIEREHCTAVHGVPTMFITILEHKDFAKYDYSSLRTGIMAGSPCPISVMKRVVSDMGATEITIAYGQTESSPVVTQTRTNDPIEKRVATVGKMLPNMEVKIVHPETWADVPPNTQGEIVARGFMVMKGYYKMPEATRQAIDENGWLHTGDLGMMDEEGYFKITGRLKDMIIRGGENIYPREIEEFLYTHPAVKDVQVVGVPDKTYGEEVMAYVIGKEGVAVTAEELIQYTKERLSRHKAPRYVHFIDEFPMTASGKIQKFKLREMAIASLKLDEAAAIETA